MAMIKKKKKRTAQRNLSTRVDRGLSGASMQSVAEDCDGGFVPVSFTASGWLGADSGGRGLAGDNVTGVAGVAL